MYSCTITYYLILCFNTYFFSPIFCYLVFIAITAIPSHTVKFLKINFQDQKYKIKRKIWKFFVLCFDELPVSLPQIFILTTVFKIVTTVPRPWQVGAFPNNHCQTFLHVFKFYFLIRQYIIWFKYQTNQRVYGGKSLSCHVHPSLGATNIGFLCILPEIIYAFRNSSSSLNTLSVPCTQLYILNVVSSFFFKVTYFSTVECYKVNVPFQWVLGFL